MTVVNGERTGSIVIVSIYLNKKNIKKVVSERKKSECHCGTLVESSACQLRFLGAFGTWLALKSNPVMA